MSLGPPYAAPSCSPGSPSDATGMVGNSSRSESADWPAAWMRERHRGKRAVGGEWVQCPLAGLSGGRSVPNRAGAVEQAVDRAADHRYAPPRCALADNHRIPACPQQHHGQPPGVVASVEENAVSYFIAE